MGAVPQGLQQQQQLMQADEADLYNVEVVYNKDEYGNPLPPQGEQYYQDPYPVGPSRGEMMLEPNRNVETVLYSAPMGEYPR